MLEDDANVINNNSVGKRRRGRPAAYVRAYAKICGHALFINKTNKSENNKVIHPHLEVCVKKRPLFPDAAMVCVCRRPQFFGRPVPSAR